MSQPQAVLVLALLCLCVALADGLARYRLGRLFGAPALSLLLACLLANLGALPAGSSRPPLYAAIFVIAAPMAIFYLLLDARLRQLRESVPAMLLGFFVAALGILFGLVLAAKLLRLDAYYGDASAPLISTFAANLVGSGSDFDVLAARFQLDRNPALYTLGLHLNAWLAVASVLLACLLAAMLQALPRYRHGAWIAGASHQRRHHADSARGHEQLASLGAFALLLVLGLAAYGLAEAGARVLAQIGLALPSILLLAVFALGVGASGLPAQLPGSRALGRFGVCLFMAVLGAHAEFAPLQALDPAGQRLLACLILALALHLAWVVAIGGWLRLDPDALAIASQASLGTASTAMAVAESRQRHDLALAAIVAGSLGNALGVVAGLAVWRLLGG